MTSTVPEHAASTAAPSRGFATLLVVAKDPVPGRVKTRLSPHYTPEQAARLAAASLADTLDAVDRAGATRRVLVLDGDPSRWLRPGLEVVAQCGGGLDERLAHAFSLVRYDEGPCLLVGMDTPQVTPELLGRGGSDAGPAAGADAWFGPAADGGFWALGFAAAPDPAWLLGVPMSRTDTGRLQRRRLTRAGLAVVDLPTLRDVDTPADALHVASLAGHGRFGSMVTRRGLGAA